jgi:hypothetical protein
VNEIIDKGVLIDEMTITVSNLNATTHQEQFQSQLCHDTSINVKVLRVLTADERHSHPALKVPGVWPFLMVL